MSEFDHKLFDAQMKKLFGAEAITNVSGVSPFSARSMYVPTSSPDLNKALGIGGIPKGRIVELFGSEGTGKSTLALDIVRNSQIAMPKRPAVYIDTENTLNIKYVADMGVDLDKKRFILSQMSITEDVLEVAYQAAQANAGIIVVDSVPGMTLRKDMEESLSTEDRVAGNSKAMRAMLKRLNSTIRETGAIALFINHITYKVIAYGNPEVTPGGTGLKFYASVRIVIRPGEKIIGSGGEVVGQIAKAEVVKNKVAPPFRKAEYRIIFGEGIDSIGGMVDAAVEAGVITKSGSWYTYAEARLGQGRENLITYLKSQPDLMKQITEQYLSVMEAQAS